MPKEDCSKPLNVKKAVDILTELKAAQVKKYAEKCVSKPSGIIIIAGSGRDRISLSCTSWQKGTALLETVMSQLDSIEGGLKT